MQRAKKYIVKAVSEILILKYDRVDRVITEFIRQLNTVLSNGDTIQIRGWGTWSIRSRGRWIGRNPKTGEKRLIKPRLRIKFKAGKILNAALNNKPQD